MTFVEGVGLLEDVALGGIQRCDDCSVDGVAYEGLPS